jgi:ankyrin repeat protein
MNSLFSFFGICVLPAAIILSGCGQTSLSPADQAALNAELLKSAEQENLSLVTELVNKGADVNCVGEGYRRLWTPLLAASKFGRGDMVSFLLSKGARVDVKDEDGQTPLGWAAITPSRSEAAEGYLEVMKLLVAAGADVNARTRSGHTPLYFARHPEISEFLRNHGGKE